jgi:hypothetical protein
MGRRGVEPDLVVLRLALELRALKDLKLREPGGEADEYEPAAGEEDVPARGKLAIPVASHRLAVRMLAGIRKNRTTG